MVELAKQESWVEGVYVEWRKEDVLKEMHEKIKREWSVFIEVENLKGKSGNGRFGEL